VYKPPPGFETASIVAATSSDLADLFAHSHLQGKQLWHITVPSTVPIDSITEVAAESVQNGKPVLSHNGSDYGLVPEVEGENGKETLLLPNSKSQDYRDANTKIVRTLHLQQMVQLPSFSHRSGLPNGVTKPPNTYKKVVRQQPEGLRMRYRPFGDSGGSLSESSDETPQFRVPAVIEAPHQSETSKHNTANDDGRNDWKSSSQSIPNRLETPKKSKKRDHDAAIGEKHDNHKSAAKSKKRKPHKANSEESNHQESPVVSKQGKPQPEAAIDSRRTKSNRHSPTKTTMAVRSSPEKPRKPQSDPDTSPITTRNRPPEPEEPEEPEEPKANLKVYEPRQNQREKESAKAPLKSHNSETPSTPAQLKPQRSNEEKRQRKEAKRRRHEARESALKDQENHPEISSC